MPKNKKPRKKYRRHPIASNPIQYAIEGAAIVSDQRIAEQKEIEAMSLFRLKHGYATLEDWETMASVNNIAQTFCAMQVGKEEVMPVCRAVEQILLDASVQFQSNGNMTISDTDAKIMEDLLEYHHLQRLSVSLSTYERLIIKTSERIRNGYNVIDVDAYINNQLQK